MTRPPDRILFVGAGYTGRLVASEYTRRGHPAVLVGFLDDRPDLQGQHVADLPVLGTIDDLPRVVGTYRVDKVVVTIPSATGLRLRQIVDACQSADVPVHTMPGILELLGQPITAGQLRPVEVGDLLRRSQVRCDEAPPDYLHGQRILITGAGGSIGSELARQVLRAGPAVLVLLGHGENSIHDVHSQLAGHPACAVEPVIADIRDRLTMRRIFDRYRPSVVFHAAAHKHVPLMEAHPVEAVRNNVLGTRNVLDAARETGVARLVFVSTDKAVAPIGVMGATKRIGEWLVSAAEVRPTQAFLTVRFGNVLGSRGSVVPVLERQLARGEPVTLTHREMRRYFMTIPEASFLVLQAGGIGGHGALLVLDMGEPIAIVDLARDLIRLSGMDEASVPIVFRGLRPGEKLVEALWEPGSQRTAAGPGLLNVQEPETLRPTPAILARLIEELDRAAWHDDEAAVRSLLSGSVMERGDSPAGSSDVHERM